MHSYEASAIICVWPTYKPYMYIMCEDLGWYLGQYSIPLMTCVQYKHNICGLLHDISLESTATLTMSTYPDIKSHICLAFLLLCAHKTFSHPLSGIWSEFFHVLKSSRSFLMNH